MIYRNLSLLASAALVALLATPVLADDATDLGAEGGINILGNELRLGSWIDVDNGRSLRYQRPWYRDLHRVYIQDDAYDAGVRYRVYEGDSWNTIAAKAEVSKHPDFTWLQTEQKRFATHYAMHGTKAKNGQLVKLYMPASWRTVVVVNDLRFVKPMSGDATLFVTEDGTTYAYVGSDFDSIVAANAELKSHPDFGTLSARVEETQTLGLRTQPLNRASDKMHQIEIVYQPRLVTVETWTWNNGKWQHEAFKGATLQEIRTSNPRAESFLSVWTTGSSDASSSTDAVLGFSLRPLEAARQRELGLSGKAWVVSDLRSEGLASRLGLKSDDVVISIGGRSFVDVESAYSTLRSNASGDLQVVVLRDGQRTTLTAKPAADAETDTDDMDETENEDMGDDYK